MRDWLSKNVPSQDEAQMHELKVVFGPGASYYAFAGGDCVYHDLPKGLTEAIEARKEEGLGHPDILALGGTASKGGTYLACWSGKAANWSLNTETSFYKLVEDGDYDELADVYLSPVRSQDFVAVKRDGRITWSIPGGMSEDTFPRYFLAHMQRNAEEFGKTYDMELTGGTEKHTLITPETKYTFESPAVSIGKKALDLAQSSVEVVADKSSRWLSWIWKS